HADAPGHQEMAELVHENQHAQDEEERESAGQEANCTSFAIQGNRIRSLKITVAISISRRTRPTASMRSLAFRLKSRRARPSSARMAMCPPSRTGIGSRFIRPRLRLIMASSVKS